MSNKMSVRYGMTANAITDANIDTSVVVFIVKDDDDKEVDQLVIDGNDLPEDNQQRAYLYGINKLLTDRTSDQKDKVAKLADMQEVFNLLCTGEWAKERVVGAIVCSPEVEALASLQEMSIPDVQAALGQYDKATRTAILGREDVVAKAKLIREARKDAPTKTLDDMIPEAK